jgi:hypothetical protein
MSRRALLQEFCLVDLNWKKALKTHNPKRKKGDLVLI